MNILAFSDIHTDMRAIERIRSQAHDADILVGAGDFANMRLGLQPVIDAIASIDTPAVLVHGNAESESELRKAAADYPHLHILHASVITLDGVAFLGLGGAVPETPFGDWSVDHSEKEVEAWLESCEHADVLISHSPPKGHCDRDSAGKSLGSTAVLRWIEKRQPGYCLCGHIHASWQESSDAGQTRVMNLGPVGTKIEL